MNRTNSIVTYALVGLAAGTAAWLLFGTKEGRKQLDRANEGIRELSKSIRKSTKEGLRKASEITNRASEELENMRAQAKDKGISAIKKADQTAKTGIKKVRSAVQATQRKAEEEI